MKRFSDLLLENLGNVYQKGTPFSNGHRSRKEGDGFLFDRHNMIDIDEVIFDSNGKIWAILENKKKTPGLDSKLKNILTTNTNQKLALVDLCKKIGCHFFVQMELENTYHLIKDLSVVNSFSSKKFDDTITSRGFTRLKTDNMVFIEFRNPISFISVTTRISDASYDVKNFAKNLSNILGVPNVQVDDSGEFIKFFLNGSFIGKVKSHIQPNNITEEERNNAQMMWVWIYKKMNIF